MATMYYEWAGGIFTFVTPMGSLNGLRRVGAIHQHHVDHLDDLDEVLPPPRGGGGRVVAPEAAKGIVAKDGTIISGFTKHGIDRAIGDAAKRAGTKPQAILDALKSPKSMKEGVDKLGRPFKIYTGQDARVVINPQTGQIVSVNPLSGAGAH
jgi:hypothetical protein